MDPIDYQILHLLQRDARTTQMQIADAVGLSQPSVADRIRKLDESGVVLGYVARLDPRRSGNDIRAFGGVRISHPRYHDAFPRRIQQIPGVLECHRVAGLDSYVVKVVSRHTERMDALVAGAPAPLQYGRTEGFGPLRAWVAERMTRRGLPAAPGQVLITAGSQQGIDLVGKALIDPGDTVVVEAPSYLAALQSFSTYEARFETVETDDDGMSADALERVLLARRVRLIYLVPNFQNPRGTTLSLERRARIARLAAQHGVSVLEDDPYGELRYRGPALPPVAGLDEDAPVIHLGTFSKTLAPGLRLGYAVADERIIRALTIAKQAADLHTASLTQRAVARMLEKFA